ncbi:hypothetical protein LXL04_034019 [Taraxacum kok-saghyz]
MDIDIVSSLIEIKGNEKDCSKGYERKQKRDSNISEKAEGSKNGRRRENITRRRKLRCYQREGLFSRLPITVENSEEEEEEVRERRSKTNMMEIVKNTRSSTRKGKEKKIVVEGGKGKIYVKGKKVVVDFEKPYRNKRQLYDEDNDEFVDETGPSRKQKGKVQEVKKPKKEVRKKLCTGDGIWDVPMNMCYYVLERLDAEKKEVVVEKGVLNVNAKSVQQMLGLPIGGTLFKNMLVVDEDDEDSCMFEWRKQYENTKDLRLKQLKNEILLMREGDLNFRINFLVMFINMFCESMSMGKCNLNALQHIKKDTDISSIDWCQYVVDCLIKTKKAYIPEKESSFFFGPASYLALLYVDGLRFERMDVPRTRPAICFWSSEMIRVREDYEMIDGGFGLGEVNGGFVEDFVDISDDEEEDREYEEEVQEDAELDSDDERSEEVIFCIHP